MIKLHCLVSPLAKSAFFADYVKVARLELALLAGAQTIGHYTVGAMDFLSFTPNLPKMKSFTYW